MISKSQLEIVLNNYKCPCIVSDVRTGGGFIDFILYPLHGTTINKLQARLNDFTIALGQVVSITIEDAKLILRTKDDTQKQIHNYFDYYNQFNRDSGNIAIGLNPRGKIIQYNLFTMPHLLVAGATGSGKSVFLHNAIISLLTCEGVSLRLIDLKKVELSNYNGLNQMISDTITDPRTAAAVLEEEVEQMQERYTLMNQYNVRHYTQLPKAANARVIIIDELADLMLNRETRKSVENSVVRIAQLGRAAGVHLILATQRPSTNVITGLIKANMPCKLAFMTVSGVDSRVIGCKGAENLSGRGDALLSIAGEKELERVQAFFVSDSELKDFVEQVKTKQSYQKPPTMPQNGGNFFKRLFS